MVKVKICGLTRQEDVDIVNRYMPEYVGFVFAKSKRQIDFNNGMKLSSSLNPKISKVGVFVDENIDFISKLFNDGVIDIAQLHGNESLEYLIDLQKTSAVKIIKAVRVRSQKDILCAEKFPCEFLLLDTYSEKVMGGGGEKFNHDIIPPLKKNFFLAGGLNCSNIKESVLKTSPYGVDVSSGVEINGVKSEKLIKEFIEKVRSL